jgi:hypothetical protein
MRITTLLAAACLTTTAVPVYAFQLAPMGSEFEARLTNETPAWLAVVAGRIGVLLKEPVHEEITQLGFGCPVEVGQLSNDTACRGADRGFASPYVIYGVRWNDLPPFRLRHNEGGSCRKFLVPTAACKVDQTVRFSTQPECWYCMFNEAKVKAATRTISGCRKGKGISRGNLLTRSHFGDLQFLHAMAHADGVPASATRQEVMDWLEFAWKVSTREIKADVFLKSIQIPGIQEHFGCSEWRVADIYILGRNQDLLPKLNHIAFGSVLHTVQDSFAGGHTSRESKAASESCPGTAIPRPPRILEFHSYVGQDGHKHDTRDSRPAMIEGSEQRWPEAVEATRRLFELNDSAAKWDDAKLYIACVMDLAPDSRPSSPGDDFRRVLAN